MSLDWCWLAGAWLYLGYRTIKKTSAAAKSLSERMGRKWMESFSAEAIPRYRQCDWTFKMGKHVQMILHGQIIQFFAFEKHSLLALTREFWKWVGAMLAYEGGLPALTFPLTSLYSSHRDGTLVRQKITSSFSGCSMGGLAVVHLTPF